MKFKRSFNILVLLLVFGNASVWAHSPGAEDPNSLKSKVHEASLIMYGQVIDIQYRNSEPSKEQPQGLPHTFVTYQVEEVLRGDAPDKHLTLRIPGGADGQGGGYMVSSAPAFARGQTDVLFIKGGGIRDCQLVECVEGRFRVHENQVLNGWGVPVVEAHKTLRIGGKPRFNLNVMDLPRLSFHALLKRPGMREYVEQVSKKSRLSLKQLKARYDREAPKYTTMNLGYQDVPIAKDVVEEPMARAIEKFGKPLSPEVFFDAIRDWSQRVGKPESKVVMADVKERFFVADPKFAMIDPVKTAGQKMSNEERYDNKEPRRKRTGY